MNNLNNLDQKATLAPIRWTSNNFDSNFSSSYNLYLSLSKSSLNLCVRNNVDSELLLLEEYLLEKDISINNQLSSFYHKLPQLQREYRDIFISLTRTEVSIIPTKLRKLTSEIYNLEHSVTVDNNMLIEEEIQELNTIVTWPFELDLKQTVSELFPKAFVSSHYANWIKEQLIMAKNSMKPQVAICSYGNVMHLLLVKKGKLLFSNLFDIENTEDLLYYTLFALEQQELNPDEVEFALTPSSKVTTDLTLVKEYFSNFRNELTHNKAKYSGLNEDSISRNQFLLNLHLCE